MYLANSASRLLLAYCLYIYIFIIWAGARACVSYQVVNIFLTAFFRINLSKFVLHNYPKTSFLNRRNQDSKKYFNPYFGVLPKVDPVELGKRFEKRNGRPMSFVERRYSSGAINFSLWEYRAFFIGAYIKSSADGKLSFRKDMSGNVKSFLRISKLLKGQCNCELMHYILGIMNDRRHYAVQGYGSDIDYVFLKTDAMAYSFDNVMECFKVELTPEKSGLRRHMFYSQRELLINAGFLVPVYGTVPLYYVNINYFKDWLTGSKMRFISNRFVNNVYFEPIKDELLSYMYVGGKEGKVIDDGYKGLLHSDMKALWEFYKGRVLYSRYLECSRKNH